MDATHSFSMIRDTDTYLQQHLHSLDLTSLRNPEKERIHTSENCYGGDYLLKVSRLLHYLSLAATYVARYCTK
jgi:hypothetical protein